MIVRVKFKDPDTLFDACNEAAKQSLSDLDLDTEEIEQLAETRSCKANELITANWCEYGEYVTVEFDTDKKTARFVVRKDE